MRKTPAMNGTPLSICWLYALLVASCFGDDSKTMVYGRPRKLAELANADIRESSGMAASCRQPGVFWTHNDSGDSARIFAFDRQGRDLGVCRLRGENPVDWEDMASFEWQGKAWLLLADIGDNARVRSTCRLVLCEEPYVTAKAVSTNEIDTTPLVFRYEDGPHNCEGMGVDAMSGVVLLATKVAAVESRIYQLDLPRAHVRDTLVARHVSTVAVPMATALDISPDGRRAIIATILDGFLFTRDEQETWQQAFGRPPQRISLPVRRQGESVCFGRDGQTLYLTSEYAPTPFWEIPVRE